MYFPRTFVAAISSLFFFLAAVHVLTAEEPAKTKITVETFEQLTDADGKDDVEVRRDPVQPINTPIQKKPA